MEFEDYFINGTNVLKNKFNITNQDELSDIERKIVLIKLTELDKKIDYDTKPNVELLKMIHKYLFEDIYYFAGEYREINMFKQTGFTNYKAISYELNECINKYLNLDITRELSVFEVAKILGELYRELINIHPFREGNGRSSREFLRRYSIYKFGYDIDYTKVNKRNFLEGILDPDTYPLLLAFELNNSLIKVKEKIR